MLFAWCIRIHSVETSPDSGVPLIVSFSSGSKIVSSEVIRSKEKKQGEQQQDPHASDMWLAASLKEGENGRFRRKMFRLSICSAPSSSSSNNNNSVKELAHSYVDFSEFSKVSQPPPLLSLDPIAVNRAEKFRIVLEISTHIRENSQSGETIAESDDEEEGMDLLGASVGGIFIGSDVGADFSIVRNLRSLGNGNNNNNSEMNNNNNNNHANHEGKQEQSGIVNGNVNDNNDTLRLLTPTKLFASPSSPPRSESRYTQEIATLKTRLAEEENFVAKLNEKLSRRTQKVNEVNAALAVHRQREEQTHTQLLEREFEIDKLQSENTMLKKTIVKLQEDNKSLTAEVGAATQAKASLFDEKITLTQQLETLEREIVERDGVIAQATADNNACLTHISSLEGERTRLEEQMTLLRHSLSTKKEKYFAAKTQLKTVEQQRADADFAREELERQVSSLNSQLIKMKRQAAVAAEAVVETPKPTTVSSSSKVAPEIVSVLCHCMSALSDANQTLSNKAQNVDDTVLSLQQRVIQLSNEVADRERLVLGLKRTVAESEVKLVKITDEEAQKWRERIEREEKNSNALILRLEAAKITNLKYCDEVSQKTTENAKLQKEVHFLSEKVANFEKRVEKEESERQNRAREEEEARAREDGLKAEIFKLKCQSKSNVLEISRLSAALAQSKSQSQIEEEEKQQQQEKKANEEDKLRSQISKFESEIAALQTSVAEKSESVSKLERMCQNLSKKLVAAEEDRGELRRRERGLEKKIEQAEGENSVLLVRVRRAEEEKELELQHAADEMASVMFQLEQKGREVEDMKLDQSKAIQAMEEAEQTWIQKEREWRESEKEREVKFQRLLEEEKLLKEKEVKALNALLEEKQAEMISLEKENKHKIVALEEKLTGANRTISELQHQLQQQQQQQEQEETSNDEKESTKDKEDSDADAVAVDDKEQDGKIEELQTQIGELEKSIETSNEELSAAKKALDESEKLRQLLVDQLKSKTDDLAALTLECDNLRLKIAEDDVSKQEMEQTSKEAARKSEELARQFSAMTRVVARLEERVEENEKTKQTLLVSNKRLKENFDKLLQTYEKTEQERRVLADQIDAGVERGENINENSNINNDNKQNKSKKDDNNNKTPTSDANSFSSDLAQQVAIQLQQQAMELSSALTTIDQQSQSIVSLTQSFEEKEREIMALKMTLEDEQETNQHIKLKLQAALLDNSFLSTENIELQQNLVIAKVAHAESEEQVLKLQGMVYRLRQRLTQVDVMRVRDSR